MRQKSAKLDKVTSHGWRRGVSCVVYKCIHTFEHLCNSAADIHSIHVFKYIQICVYSENIDPQTYITWRKFRDFNERNIKSFVE